MCPSLAHAKPPKIFEISIDSDIKLPIQVPPPHIMHKHELVVIHQQIQELLKLFMYAKGNDLNILKTNKLLLSLGSHAQFAVMLLN